MSNKDELVKKYIFKHFDDLNESLQKIDDNYEMFLKEKVIQKAISFDLLQIGELFNDLSNETLSSINKRDVRGIIDVRNYIAHGYIYIKNSELWKTIHFDLPNLIEQLKK